MISMDLISKQTVIDRLNDWANHTITNAEAWHLRQVIGDIRSMPAGKPAEEWIPCEERLPDIEQDVLATTTLFGVREVTFAWRINDGEWLIREGSSEATNNDILAWMPLPELYEGGDLE